MKIVALAGGVGGAKLAYGLAQVLPPANLTIIVNTADDFEHLGLYISPDVDTVCYTLAGLANPDAGWGRDNETWQAMTNIAKLGGPDWFQLGDQDLATHLERTRLLKEGLPLSQIVSQFCRSWGILHRILPMSDQPVRTIVKTDQGELPFQEYFVHRGSEPHVTGFEFRGAETATPAPGAIEALSDADAVVICPSNPWVSIEPILAIPGFRDRISAKTTIAVSPIIGGKAVKGPAARMFADLGIQPSALAVAEHYRGLIKGFVLDKVDREFAQPVQALQMRALVAKTLMRTSEDRRRLAKDVLDFIRTIS
jgi:LPPG:FO 2-phospho-L-lactate transferase